MNNVGRSVLVGVTSALLVPAAAAGQLDAGQTVGQAVGEVGDVVSQVQPQTPVQVPAAPVKPASPPAQPAAPQVPQSAPAGPAPASSGGAAGGSGGGSTGGGATSGAASGSKGGGAAKAGSRGGAKARAAGKGKAGRDTVLAQKGTGNLSPEGDETFSGAVTTNPSTGVEGDPNLPFTGGHVLLLLAMGIFAMAAGLAVRNAARRRHVG
jgi:hypothetical protein